MGRIRGQLRQTTRVFQWYNSGDYYTLFCIFTLKNGAKENQNLSSTAAHQKTNVWLVENGPKELELLFRAIPFGDSAPIFLTDSNRECIEVSVGACKLLGLHRRQIIGRQIDDFAYVTSKPSLAELWRTFLEEGEQEGTIELVGRDKSLLQVGYRAKGNVLPGRHVIVLHDQAAVGPVNGGANRSQAWVRDYALCSLDVNECITAWYSGATRVYGYSADEVIGRHVSFLYSVEDVLKVKLLEDFQRAAAEGHRGTEGWQAKKSGLRFWANVITLALRDESGALQGFARVARDFSRLHGRDEGAERRVRPPRADESMVAGIVSGEFDQIPEANDAFLEMVGYSREDLLAGEMHWPDLTPPEYLELDERAHEEGLKFGASTPFEKELIRKDGARVPVLVATAVLKLAPFRWIAFVQDLRERDRVEGVDEINEDKPGFEEMVGGSSALKRILQQTEVVAPTDATVLILGETGTGKELIARAIHRMSPRRDLPCITLNCAAIPTGLLESELFGYERGAFTGALSQKIGRFEMAHRGTLFLDEVGDIPLDLQPKLLRALQEKSFERLGGTRTIPIDVRLVAATNRNLTQMMGDKLFRSDLYYRLKVFPITVPPLRDRPEDIPILARHFTKKYSAKMGRQIDKIPVATMQALVNWDWPGNVRELENFIERAVILSGGNTLRAPLAEIRHATAPAFGTVTLKQVEREHIVRVLKESRGVVSTAAIRLGLHRTTLNAIMRKLGISRKDF